MKTVALIGERVPEKPAHRGIEASFGLFRGETGSDLAYRWMDTEDISRRGPEAALADMSGVWCVPGSHCRSRLGVFGAIRHARSKPVPFLGTCAGFQYALMEFSVDVLGRPAAHEELDPQAKDLLIVQLSCSLVGTKGRVISTPGPFARILGARESVEEFNCDYGLNPNFEAIFQDSDLEFVAHDEAGQPRVLRLKSHPFFIGTLFQPERRALTGSLHPIVRAFFQAASGPDR